MDINDQEKMTGHWLTIKETCLELGVSEKTVRRYIGKDLLEAMKTEENTSSFRKIVQMSFIYLCVTIAPIILYTSICHSANWVSLGPSKTGKMFYIDIDNIDRQSNTVKCWGKNIDKSGEYYISLFLFNINDKSLKILMITHYDHTGLVKDTFTWSENEAKKEYVVPGSSYDGLLKAAINYSKR